jgi:hypothetical protein
MLQLLVHRYIKSLSLLIAAFVVLGSFDLEAARRRKGRAKPRKVERRATTTAPAAADNESDEGSDEPAVASPAAAVVSAGSGSEEIIPGSGTGVVAEGEAPGTAKGAPTLLITGFVDMGFAFAQNKGVGYAKKTSATTLSNTQTRRRCSSATRLRHI